MNRSSVAYEPEEGDMEFSEHDRKIIGSKVAKATFRGNVTPMRGGGRKSHRKMNIKPGWLDVREQLRQGLLDEVDDA